MLVTDQRTGSVVHSVDWKGDSEGAKQGLEEIEQDLDRLTIAEFCKEYGVELSS